MPLGSGRVGSDDLGYGPGSGFSFEPVQTSSPQATEQQKTITDHSRNVIVILYIVFILNMVNILKVCTCNQKFLFAHIYCKLLFFMFVCIDCYLQIVKSCSLLIGQIVLFVFKYTKKKTLKMTYHLPTQNDKKKNINYRRMTCL